MKADSRVTISATKTTKSKTKQKQSKAQQQQQSNENSNTPPSSPPSSSSSSPSSLLNDCNLAFGKTDLYEIFNLTKEKATPTEIKKAYYKLSLKHHPDKVDASKKEESNFKFQVLGKIYSILSDESKRKYYDETGQIDGEDEIFMDDGRDWDNYWRMLFKKVTKDDIAKYFLKYKNSDDERKDLYELYEKHKGDMDLILEEMLTEEALLDEERFKKILNEGIDNGKIAKYDKFVNESKRKTAKRRAFYEKEAKEAEELKKELGIDDSQDSLRNAILTRRKNQTDSFLDHLANKYGKQEKETKTNNKTTTTTTTKKAVKHKLPPPTSSSSKSKVSNNKKKPIDKDDEDDEDEDEDDDEDIENKIDDEDEDDEKTDDDDDDDSNDDDDDEDEATPPKKSSLIKKKSLSTGKKPAKAPAKTTTLKKRVKRL